MPVTIREAAKLLNATEEQIYDWIQEEALPAYKIHDQYRIHRSELLEWATARKKPVAPALFQETEEGEPVFHVSDCLRRGGIHYEIGGSSRQEILRNIVQVLNLQDEEEREVLLDMLLARETLGSTSIGDGIAIPHVRNPVVLTTDEPLLSLCYIHPSSDFGSPDGKPIYALFVLIAPTIRVHLQMLARLAYLLQNPEFRELVRLKKSPEEIIAAAERLEATA